MPAVTWTTAFNQAPTDTDLVSDGDERIEETRATVQDELVVEHDTGTIDNDYLDTGRHKTGSARAFFQADAPTTLLQHWESVGGDWLPTAQETDRLGSADLDNGRLWVDFNDCQPYVREEETTAAAWTDINANHGPPNNSCFISLWPRSQTILKQATVTNDAPVGDDTRVAITGIQQAIAVPNDGRDYCLKVTAYIKYAVEGPNTGGFWLVEDPAGAATVRDVSLFRTDGSRATRTANLVYLNTSPTNGTTYTFDVEMACEDAPDLEVNPDTTAGGFNNNAAPYNVTDGYSYLEVELKPYYLVASYTQT